MAIRFAPFARVRVLSLAAKIIQQGTTDPFAITRLVSDLSALKNRLDTIDPATAGSDPTGFVDVGLATEINITENFNVKSVYGIGQPADPALIPGNLSVRVTISRLTTDSKQISDYISKPVFYYNPLLQKLSAYYGSNATTNGIQDLDALFYTYLHVNSIEVDKFDNTSYPSKLDNLQNYEIIAFMPTSFTKRISSQNAEITTEMEGEGKLFKLADIQRKVINAINGIDGESLKRSGLLGEVLNS